MEKERFAFVINLRIEHNTVAMWLPDSPHWLVCHAGDSTSFAFVRVPDLERLELVEQDSADVPKTAPAFEGHVSPAGDPAIPGTGSRQELYGKVECVSRFDICARCRWKTK
jgi:hypothetical protein